MPEIVLTDTALLRLVSPPDGVPVRLERGRPQLVDPERALQNLEVCLSGFEQPLPVLQSEPGRWTTDPDWAFLRRAVQRLRHPDAPLEDWLDAAWPELPPTLALSTALEHPDFGGGRPLLALLLDIGVGEFDLIAALKDPRRSSVGLATARVPVRAPSGASQEASLLGHALAHCCHALATELDALGVGLTSWEKASGRPLRSVAEWNATQVSEGFPASARRALVRRWRRRLLELGVGRTGSSGFDLASGESPLTWVLASLSGSSPLLTSSADVRTFLAEWRTDLLDAGDPWVDAPAHRQAWAVSHPESASLLPAPIL